MLHQLDQTMCTKHHEELIYSSGKKNVLCSMLSVNVISSAPFSFSKFVTLKYDMHWEIWYNSVSLYMIYSNSLTHMWMTLNSDTHFTFSWHFWSTTSKIAAGCHNVVVSLCVCVCFFVAFFASMGNFYLLALFHDEPTTNKAIMFIMYWLMNDIPMKSLSFFCSPFNWSLKRNSAK